MIGGAERVLVPANGEERMIYSRDKIHTKSRHRRRYRDEGGHDGIDHAGCESDHCAVRIPDHRDFRRVDVFLVPEKVHHQGDILGIAVRAHKPAAAPANASEIKPERTEPDFFQTFLNGFDHVIVHVPPVLGVGVADNRAAMRTSGRYLYRGFKFETGCRYKKGLFSHG